MKDCKQIAEKAIDEWFGYQDKIELEFTLRMVQKFNPKVILEIGTAHNSSLAAWAAVTDADLIIGIDPLTLPKTVQQQQSFDNLVKAYNLQIIPYRSEEPQAHEKLNGLLGNRKVDFLFLDAEHLYENIKYDYYEYLKYMNNPSIIGFNDIYYSDQLSKAGTGVHILWEKLKKIYKYDEIHAHSTMGNGLIYYPERRKDMSSREDVEFLKSLGIEGEILEKVKKKTGEWE